MKNIKFLIFAFASLLIIHSCEEDNELIFVASPDADGIAFTNSFSSEYLLSEETEDNIAERFVWNAPDFGAPTNVTYELSASIDPALANAEIVGSNNQTNIAVSVAQLLDFAEELGLDDDPNTTDADGNPNNVGSVYFRLRAFAGAGTGNNTEVISDIQTLNIKWLEKIDPGTCDPIFLQ